MKIITLVGPPNSGKTTTIKKVIGELLASGAIVSKKSVHSYFKGMRSSDGIESFFKKGDISIELSYSNREIGITSFGDSEDTLRNKIEFFESNGCECCICGSHPSGNSYNYIQSLEHKKSNKIIWVSKIRIDEIKIRIDEMNIADIKYKILCDISDSLAMNEIISNI